MIYYKYNIVLLKGVVMSKKVVEKYISDTMIIFRANPDNSDCTEEDFKWMENYIRSILYKKYNIRG